MLSNLTTFRGDWRVPTGTGLDDWEFLGTDLYVGRSRCNVMQCNPITDSTVAPILPTRQPSLGMYCLPPMALEGAHKTLLKNCLFSPLPGRYTAAGEYFTHAVETAQITFGIEFPNED